MTNAETIPWSRIRRDAVLKAHFRRQHPIGCYVADFACVHGQLVIEVDGGTHFEEPARLYDERRERYLRARGWRVIRVTNEDVYRNLNGVLDYIYENLPQPSSARM